MKNDKIKSIELAIKSFQNDLINPRKSFVMPSYARREIDRLKDLLLVSV